MADEQPPPGIDPRISVRMRVRISTIDPETDPWTGKTYFRTSEETCANVSRGGAFVETREMIAPGSRLLLELELPGGHSVQAMGRVAWTKARLSHDPPAGKNAQSGIGVEFLGGPPGQRLALERFLARSTRRQRLANDPASFSAPTARR